MDYFINEVSISNFKSIQHCRVSRCKRINLFIGRPNVGKSNLIEALSLFSIPYLIENTSRNITSLIRLESETELFHEGNTEQEVTVDTGIAFCRFKFHRKNGSVVSIAKSKDIFTAPVDDRLNIITHQVDRGYDTRMKRYVFNQKIEYRAGHSKYLIPPFGANLLSIIENYPELKEEVTSLFKENNLEIAFDRASQTVKVIRKNKGDIFLIPYNSIADTLQRVIFYKAAIASNDDSVLLFEEPEAHAFPPYMTQLTQDMIHKRDNQYFIATHSPFILNDLLENAPEELAVFVVYWENGSTQVRALSKDEMHEAYRSGVDFFTNSESFIG